MPTFHLKAIVKDVILGRTELIAHEKAGFKEMGVTDGFLQMMITKDEYVGK